MGFDTSLLKSVLESFVENIDEESSELVLERPRFAYAVVVVADEREMCQASCVRQLDYIEVMQTPNTIVDLDPIDADIQRALRELSESRDLLESPRQSIMNEIAQEHSFNNNDKTPLSNEMTKELIKEINRSAKMISRKAEQFPSLSRPRKEQ
uniref:Uncharacterized protein n=1 Tax=Heterorhabditis bacteriophora TaxID=37862 RepID=A0A1I7XG66_HETBA